MRETTRIAALALTTALGIAAAQIPGVSPTGRAVGQLTTPSQSQALNQPQAPLPPAGTPISAQQRDAAIDAKDRSKVHTWRARNYMALQQLLNASNQYAHNRSEYGSSAFCYRFGRRRKLHSPKL